MIRKYLLPSLFYFMVTLVSGVWIRLQWADPSWMVFNPKYLIHSHSHVAMLGWLYMGLAGLISIYGMNETGRRRMGHPLYILLLHACIAGMIIAFALQGYAFYSILLSTVFIFLSLWFAYLYFRHEDMGVTPLTRNFLNAAVFWMVFSSTGPLALAGGAMMGPDWIQGWVAFYLHLQFNGWITFAVAGIFIAFLEKSDIRSEHRAGHIAFRLLFIGVFPSLEPMVRQFTGSPLWMAAGITGSFLVLAGTIVLAFLLFKSANRLTLYPRLLLRVSLAALVLKSLFHAMGSLPGMGQDLLQTHLTAIGFVHLLLLGFASTAILWFILAETNPLPWTKTARYGSMVTITGIASMVGLLFLFGVYQYMRIPVFLPVQWILLGTGIIVLLGGCMLFTSVIKAHMALMPGSGTTRLSDELQSHEPSRLSGF